MDYKDIAEQAYKNGYEKAKEEARAEIEQLKKETLEKAQGLAMKTIFSLTKAHKNELEQAVKDTAKEIYQELCGHGTTYVKKWIKERYGVEVE